MDRRKVMQTKKSESSTRKVELIDQINLDFKSFMQVK